MPCCAQNEAPASLRTSRLASLATPLALLLLSTFLLLAAPDEKRITIYSAAANYSLPVIEHNGQDYAGLFEMLEPLGTVVSKTDGSRWKLRYNSTR